MAITLERTAMPHAPPSPAVAFTATGVLIAEAIQGYLAYTAFSECMSYPVTAKYHMNLIGIPMEIDSRSRKKSEFDNYQKDIVRQGIITDKAFVKLLNI